MRRAGCALLLAWGLIACQPGDASREGEAATAAERSPALALRSANPDRVPFDYWVLALSWSPEYCASPEARPGAKQCAQAREFIVHGLWPQYERGYPESCDSRERVSDRVADGLGELIPDRGLVFHQWRKHGSCSGLSSEAYFEELEQAARTIVIPRAALKQAAAAPTTDARVLERAFIDANPGLAAESIVLDCRQQFLREVRICLDLSLAPRACGADIRERCGRKLKVRPPDG